MKKKTGHIIAALVLVISMAFPMSLFAGEQESKTDEAQELFEVKDQEQEFVTEEPEQAESSETEDDLFAMPQIVIPEPEKEEEFDVEEIEAASADTAAEKISLSSVTLKSDSKKYTGTARTQTQGLVVKAFVDGTEKTLKKGRDYTVSYRNNINVGTASVIVEGKGSYTGKITRKFKITPVKLGSVKTKYTYKAYNGTPRTMDGTTTVKATVNGSAKTLKKGRDYTISYKNNVNVGTATMIIKGKGNFKGTLTKTFKIYPSVTVEKTRVFRRNNYKWYAKMTASGAGTVWTKSTNENKGLARDTVGGLCYDSFGRYFYYDNGTLVALDVLTGKELWRYSNATDVECGVHVCVDTAGKVYIVSGQAGNPIAVLSKDGKLQKRISWRSGSNYTLPGDIRYKSGRILLDVKTKTGSDITLEIHP